MTATISLLRPSARPPLAITLTVGTNSDGLWLIDRHHSDWSGLPITLASFATAGLACDAAESMAAQFGCALDARSIAEARQVRLVAPHGSYAGSAEAPSWW